MSNSTSQSNANETPNEPDTAAHEAKNAELFKDYEWMIRPCGRYKGEYKECKSWRGRFQQYFVYGENQDCDQWREDYNNCQKWAWFENKNAALELIKSEMKRSDERMEAHFDNTVWTKRDKPPEDWNKPLPDWMEKRNENSFLSLQAEKLQDEKDAARARQAANQHQSGIAANTSSTPNVKSFCSVM